MKKRIMSICSIMIAFVMLIGLPACASKDTTATATSPETSASTETPKREVVQIDVFSASTSSTTAAGIYDNTWWGKILMEEAGVSLNVLPTGDQAQEKLQALMASGELPDVVIFKTTNDVQSAIRGNMLLNLDEHLDKMPNVKKVAEVALQYARDNLSNDTGIAYVVRDGIGPADLGIEPNWGPYLRWDLYTAVGSPEINTFDDYLPALKKMQELQPKSKDEKNTYGLTLWKDWDNFSMFLATEIGPTLGIDSGDQLAQLPFLEVDFKTGSTKNILDEDSMYMKALKFYYDANQLGLVDPDSLTQTYDTAKSKITEGRIFWSWWPWLNDAYNTSENTDAEEATGFAAVLPKDTKTLLAGPNTIGKVWPFAVSSASKKVDACLSYIDFMYSPDGLQSLLVGPEGVIWELDSDNKPRIMDEGWKYINDPSLELPGGGKLRDGQTIGSFGLSTAFINPRTGEPINYQLWESTTQYRLDQQTKLQKDWSSVTGYETTLDYLRGNDMIVDIPQAQSFVPTMTDDISAASSRIGDIVKTNSWKMVFAKDDAEFNQLFEEMRTKADGLGLETVYEWSLDNWEKAKIESEKYE